MLDLKGGGVTHLQYAVLLFCFYLFHYCTSIICHVTFIYLVSLKYKLHRLPFILIIVSFLFLNIVTIQIITIALYF